MKYSEAMLKGFETVDGRQHRGGFADDISNPSALCVSGAVNVGMYGHPRPSDINRRAKTGDYSRKFEAVWGYLPSDLNDDGLEWEEIYGMAVAAGL